MLKKINKLVGLKKTVFDDYVANNKIILSKPKLIPPLKTKSEIAITSILLSSLRLVKEFRYEFFKEIKLKKNGKVHFYTEVCFKDIDSSSRIDGLIIVEQKGVIQDAVFIELKNGKNLIDNEQILKYYKVAQALNNVPKILTISNEFVSDSSASPIKIKNQSKKISLYHFSWTYIKTIAQLLLFKNDDNIDDVDQVEIMKEVMQYFEHKESGVDGFHRMSNGWKEISEKIKNEQSISNEEIISDAVTSWHQEEKDMSLMLSRQLGVLVKPEVSNLKNRLANDVKKLKKEHSLSSKLKIKGAVSNIKVTADFDRRVISMSVNITPPLNKGVIARISWIKNQLEKMNVEKLKNDLYIDADIKYTANSIKYKFENIDNFYEHEDIKNKDIIGFDICYIKTVNFTHVGKFVDSIEEMLLDFYQIIVQDLKTWEKPAPKLVIKKEELITEED